MTGDILMMASDEQRHAHYCKLAATQGFHLHPSDIPNIPKDELLRMILPPGGVQRFQEWLKDNDKKGSLGGTLLFDAAHHVHAKGSTSGTDWPVNLRHGTVVAAHWEQDGKCSWKVACPFEYLVAMGFHMFPEMAHSWGLSPLHSVLSDYSAAHIQHLVGNGMHLVTQASFMLYTLSFITVRGSEVKVKSCKKRKVFRDGEEQGDLCSE